MLFAIYEVLALAYYAYRRVHFLRRGSVFVFSSHIPNAYATRHTLYTLRDTTVTKCRRVKENDLRFALIATRKVGDERLEFVLAVAATVNFTGSDRLFHDPKTRAINEISSAVTRYVAECDDPYFYLLFGTSGGGKTYVNEQCMHVKLHTLRVTIDDVIIRPCAANLPDNDTSTADAP